MVINVRSGVLVQADESVMAIIKAIDGERSGFILDQLDEQTCLVQPDKVEELERLVKAVCVETAALWDTLMLT
jgi:hypothetical protein